MRKGLTVLAFMLVLSGISAQKLDSLKGELGKMKQDTNYIKTVREIVYYYLFDEPDYTKALAETRKGLKIAQKIKSHYWSGKMSALMGYIESNYGTNIQNAIQHNFDALKYYDLAKKEYDKLSIYINLTSLYHEYNQLEDAEKYSLMALEIAEKYDADEDRALIYSNLGSVYNGLKKDQKALEYLNLALNYYKETGNEEEIARCEFGINNIKVNNLKISLSEKKECIAVYERLKEVFQKNGEQEFYVGTLINLGVLYDGTGNYEKAKSNLTEAVNIALEQQNYPILISAYSTLAKNAFFLEDYQQQAEYLQKLIAVTDSLFTQNKAKAISEVQIKYQTEKIEASNQLLKKEGEIKDLELSKKDIEIAQSNMIKFTLIGGLALIFIFTGFLYNRFQVTNKQKKTIEQQKLLVEIKQKEITDSIKYAKRLQEAILPSQEVIKKYLPESFLLYKPKDIVAGDFYFFEQNKDTLFIAAADCTGHGVPGAMVSVVCSNALHRCIKEFNLTDPGKILDKTRELVVETFEKSGQSVRDGMDIALCVIKNGVLSYAGANNPLWIFRNGEFSAVQADKLPIGKYDIDLSYTTHKVKLDKEDTIYIFTDGYCDQFGGPKGKKFKAKNFAELLHSLQTKGMELQRKMIDIAFENWKGDLEQIDDVCVIGFKV